MVPVLWLVMDELFIRNRSSVSARLHFCSWCSLDVSTGTPGLTSSRLDLAGWGLSGWVAARNFT